MFCVRSGWQHGLVCQEVDLYFVDAFTVLKMVGCKPQQMNSLFRCIRICVNDLLMYVYWMWMLVVE